MNHKVIRIGVFYDGSYFSRVSLYYRYQERNSRLNIKGLHDYIKEKVADFEETYRGHCQIVDAHYFRGRFNAFDAAKRDNQLFYDRIFDDQLMYAGVISHFVPMSTDKTRKLEKSEKGVDVLFALETYEHAVYKKFDVIVLLTGDGDYIPLVKKLNTLGAKVMLLYWELNFPKETGMSPIRANSALIREATYEINMAEEIRVRAGDEAIEGMFTSIDEELEVAPPKVYESNVYTGDYDAEEVFEGEIIHIDHDKGIGNIRSTNDIRYTNIIFFRKLSNNFDAMDRGSAVTFRLGHNDKGIIAVEVTPNGAEGDEDVEGEIVSEEYNG